VQRFSDDPLTMCPACGGTLRKVFSPVGIVFKGSGFYRTDSRNGSVPAKGKANGDGSGAGDKDQGSKDKKADADSGSSTKSGTKPSQPAAAASST
jgi:predicted nucleic acid-binding Zn ribbon protein